MMDKPTPDFSLDARGMQCPMPILKAKKQIKELEIGQILEVISDDPGSKEDFPRWAKRTGNDLLGIFEEDGYARYFIKRQN